jgi:hypothetical protein
MKHDNLSIREYTAGDAPGTLKLFAEVFGKPRTAAEWNWLYMDNPHGKGRSLVGVSGDEILAHYGVARGDLNFRGKRIPAGQSGDAFVHSSLRRNGIFADLIDRCYKLTEEDGLEATYGIPNRLSYPGAVRYLGWCRIVNLSYFFHRIGFEKAWGSGADRIFKFFETGYTGLKTHANRLRYRRKLDVTVSSSVPEGLDDLLSNKRTYEVLAVWKDPQYLKWRYDNHPRASYLFHTGRTGGKIQAVLITRDLGDRIAICDLLHRDNDDVPSILLIDHVVGYYARTRVQKIEFYGHDAGFFQFVFSLCGFRQIPFSALVFGGRLLSNPDLEKVFLLPDSWTVAYGDSDVI